MHLFTIDIPSWSKIWTLAILTHTALFKTWIDPCYIYCTLVTHYESFSLFINKKLRKLSAVAVARKWQKNFRCWDDQEDLGPYLARGLSSSLSASVSTVDLMTSSPLLLLLLLLLPIWGTRSFLLDNHSFLPPPTTTTAVSSVGRGINGGFPCAACAGAPPYPPPSCHQVTQVAQSPLPAQCCWGWVSSWRTSTTAAFTCDSITFLLASFLSEQGKLSSPNHNKPGSSSLAWA